MTDRPILFSAPMVRALIDGRKTQTRRILKPQLQSGFGVHREEGSDDWMQFNRFGEWLIPLRFAVGDRLWVRETWRTNETLGHLSPANIDNLLKGHEIRCPVRYEADGLNIDGDNVQKWGKTRVSIHMPRWASRLTLTVAEVRVERLQDISEADCIAEGPPTLQYMQFSSAVAALSGPMVIDPAQPHVSMTPRNWYRNLWDTINGAGAWDANPWIVAVTFQPELRNIDHG